MEVSIGEYDTDMGLLAEAAQTKCKQDSKKANEFTGK